MATPTTMLPTEVPAGIRDATGRPRWGSDLVIDVLRLLGIEYAAVLPGSTFRGIHDSAVNYGANVGPELILCNHEMITVAMARGYTRVTGRPMAAIVHNVVGLLNTSMTIYDAWCDRAPVLVLGATGPMDASKRRPWIDWIHTANVQGNLVRSFTKWDDQPASVASIPEALLRGYRIAMTEPHGPVYVCFDADLQEQELNGEVALPDIARYAPPPPPAPDPGALRETARLLVRAERPLVLADRVGRSAESVRQLVQLAELLALPVADLGWRQSFPMPHALDFAGAQKDLLRQADVVLGLEVLDLDGALRLPVDPATRAAARPEVAGQKVIHVTVDDLLHRGQMADYQALPTVDVPITATAASTLPLLLEEVERLLDAGARARIEQRRSALAERQQRLRERQERRMREQWDSPQISEARLAAELWEAVKAEDFVLVAGRLRRMAPGVWNIPGPERSVAGGGGGAVGAGPGVALGAALALRSEGKLPAAIMGDGESYASIQALWTAAHFRIPLLWVVNNNRSYYNDEDHQDRIARVRDRPPENRWVAMRMEDPAVDFAAMARAVGLAGEGPIRDVADLGPALRRAVAAVRSGQAAIVDVWTANRDRG